VIIVAGFLRVEADQRASYLAGCVDVIRAARAAPGCIDFHLSPDPLEPGRINVYEQWASAEDVERFRGSGPADDQQAAILDATVVQHLIASSTSLT
jgi:quinol monooxygenase YgiN